MALQKLFFLAMGLFATGCATTHETVETDGVLDDGWSRALEIEVSSASEVSKGSASWLAPGLVITSSHLFLGKSNSFSVRVGENGVWQEATVEVAEHPASLDLAILRVSLDSALAAPALPPIDICASPVLPAQKVFVVSAFKKIGTVSYGSPDYVTLNKGGRWTANLTGYFPEGTSGGAIYDSKTGCLAGVISKRQKSWSSQGPQLYTTRFVTSAEISGFIRDSGVRLETQAQR